MNKLIAVTAVVCGILLLIVPRFILPACEYEGYAPMHCSDTARAEYLMGALLTGLGVISFFFRSNRLLLAASTGAVAVLISAFSMPDVYGYCRSSRMPCNYGMVPGVRFVAVTGTIILAAAGVNLGRKAFRKGNS